MPGEITSEHLSKKAYIYVRQSSPHQVQDHRESKELQYNLHQRAQDSGWSKHNIVVIDEDLGITASGTKKRTGFENLMSQLCLGDVGALFFISASRLARNGREWHQALEVCSIFGTLIIDRDGIYDPRLPSDRLWLGMKASFSEYEFRQLQALAREAILNKAQRGELIQILPAGFIRTEDNRIELDPDLRIQQVIRSIFAKFDQLGSIRQVCKWYLREGIEVPVRDVKNGCKIRWRVPVYMTLHRILTNPLYAGAYMYPKTKTITRIIDGQVVKTAGHRVGPDDNFFLHKDLFPSYISWDKFEQNQKIIANNANMKGQTVQGAAREGNSLLAGLIRCGHCGRKMVLRHYSGRSSPYYFCQGARSFGDTIGCLSFSGRLLEAMVSREIIVTLQPVAIEAAILAEEKLTQSLNQKSDAIYHALQQAKYEADRIERQFNAVEPENYLVSRTLAARWQEALEKVDHSEQKYNQLLAEQQPLSDQERNRLFDLAQDFQHVWSHPDTDFRTKTRLVRLLIKEIWVKAVDDHKIKATIHWQGGVHTTIELKRRGRGNRRDDDKEHNNVDLIKRLAEVCDDQQIARILNRLKYKTKSNQTWTEADIAEYRKANNVPAFSQQKYDERSLVNLSKAAQILDISAASVLELIKCGLINAKQVIKYAPWEIERTELEKSSVRQAVAAIKNGKKIPFHENQLNLNI